MFPSDAISVKRHGIIYNLSLSFRRSLAIQTNEVSVLLLDATDMWSSNSLIANVMILITYSENELILWRSVNKHFIYLYMECLDYCWSIFVM